MFRFIFIETVLILLLGRVNVYILILTVRLPPTSIFVYLLIAQVLGLSLSIRLEFIGAVFI